jgi:hypothetical protein
MRGQPCETNAAHTPTFRVVLLALIGLAFAAVLGSVSLANRGDAGPSTRLSPVPGVSAVRNDQGLQLALSVPREPYFRTELLAPAEAAPAPRPLRPYGRLPTSLHARV